MDLKMNPERWQRLMESLHLPSAHATFDTLVQAYTAADRRYHNDTHIAHCLAELDAAAPHIPNPEPIELALWFHDAIYDTHSANNEDESARLASAFLTEVGAADELTATVVALILATCHQPANLSPAEQWMVDIDLAILGSSPQRFAAYEQAIRQEYAWVPDAIFSEKRIAILHSFLDRPVIYTTPHFYAICEDQARSNLTDSIRRLQRG